MRRPCKFSITVDELHLIQKAATVIPIISIDNEISRTLASTFTRSRYETFGKPLAELRQSLSHEIDNGIDHVYLIETDSAAAAYTVFPAFDIGNSTLFYEVLFETYTDVLLTTKDAGYQKIVMPLSWDWVGSADANLIVDIARTAALIYKSEFKEIIFNCADPVTLHFLSLKI